MGIIKTLLFHLLLTFRRPILFLSGALALVFLTSFALITHIPELPQTPMPAKAMMVMLGILFTTVYWFYGYLIFYLKPKFLDIRFNY